MPGIVRKTDSVVQEADHISDKCCHGFSNMNIVTLTMVESKDVS